MERGKRKALNFDLDTNEMKKRDMYPKGYSILGGALKKYGFEHRQGSGYVSKERLDSMTVARIVGKLTQEYPWLAECVNKIDVTDIGRQHDLTDVVRLYSEQTEDLLPIMETEDNSPKLTM